MIWEWASRCRGDLDKVQGFLVSGLTLFAPYLVNKFASVFESLAPKNR